MRWMALLMLGCMIGCSQQSVQGTRLQLRMFAPQQAVLLIVDENGRVSYGGGHDALEDTTTWQGNLTESQRDQFDAMIASSDWLNADMRWGNPVEGFEISIKQETIDNTFLLPLSDQTASSMYDFLQSIAIARLEPTLDALPKPSMDTIIDRKVSGMTDQ